MSLQIQRVSMKDSNYASQILESFLQTGFAIVSDHNVQSRLITDSYSEWKKFFASQAKFKLERTPGNQVGYFPLKSENAAGYSAKDLKEFFHFYPDHEWKRGLKPSLLKLSHTLAGQLNDLAYYILDGLDVVLPDHAQNAIPLSTMSFLSPNTLLRALHYPPLPANLEESQAVRAASHTDINLITLRPAATAPGLQVQALEGSWLEADTLPGDIIVNVGDMLQEATERYLTSTQHRVVNPIGENISRYSLPFFVHPRPDVRLSARYTAHEYLMQRLKEIGIL